MGKLSQSQINASEKYRKANIRQILVKVNMKTQPNLHAYLGTIENTQRYILDLVEEDMRRQGLETDS